MKGRKKDAISVLEKISTNISVSKELAEIEQSFHLRHQTSLKLLFGKTYRPVIFIGVLVAVFQQVTGINSIIYYAPVIFKETGISCSSSLFQTIIIGVVNVISTFVAIGLVDKIGRRKLLLTGSVLMGISLISVGLSPRPMRH